jgi:MFS family permease
MPKVNKKVLFAMTIAEILATIEITMIYAALRFLVEDFGSPDAIGWAITGFLLVSAVSVALGGRLGDIYDRRLLLLIVIALSILGSLIAGSTSILAMVILGRAIQGSAGAIFPLCIGILREHIEPRSLPIYIGVLTAIMSVSGGMGILLGGLIVDYLTWHWIFYINAFIGVIAWLSVYFTVPAGKPGKAEPGTNFLGGILFAPGIACVILAIRQVKDWGWTDILTLSLLAIGAILIFIWIRSELRAKVPLLNIRLLLNRNILLANVATALFGLTWMQFGQTWSLLLQQPSETGSGLGLSASFAGLIMQPQTFMALIGGPMAGWFFIRFGPRFSAVFGAMVLGSAWVAAMVKHDSIGAVLVLMVVMGFASAFLVSVLITIIAKASPANRTSEAIGMLGLVRTLGNSIGAIIVFHLLSRSTVPGPAGRGQFPDSFSYNLTMGYIAGGLFLIAALYLLFYRPLPPETETVSAPTRTSQGADA